MQTHSRMTIIGSSFSLDCFGKLLSAAHYLAAATTRISCDFARYRAPFLVFALFKLTPTSPATFPSIFTYGMTRGAQAALGGSFSGRTACQWNSVRFPTAPTRDGDGPIPPLRT